MPSAHLPMIWAPADASKKYSEQYCAGGVLFIFHFVLHPSGTNLPSVIH